VNPTIREKIDQFVEMMPLMIEKFVHILARLIIFGALVALCALPFILIQHQTRDGFWYCLGAYGFYLFGVAQLIGRWI